MLAHAQNAVNEHNHAVHDLMGLVASCDFDRPKSRAVLEGYLESSVHHKLVDFDVHLDDSSRDWLNTGLLA